jgi:aspartyl-tRNA(Asn)/glutamyl-tRNA(Gln) amidotransferase subunit C
MITVDAKPSRPQSQSKTSPQPLQSARTLFSALHFGGTLSTLTSMSDFNVKYVAHLARLSLTPEEEQKFGAQLGQVLGYIEKLKEVDVSQVEPTAHAVPLVNVTRADVVRPSLPNEDALRNAPLKSNGLFVVPKIVE